MQNCHRIALWLRETKLIHWGKGMTHKDQVSPVLSGKPRARWANISSSADTYTCLCCTRLVIHAGVMPFVVEILRGAATTFVLVLCCHVQDSPSGIVVLMAKLLDTINRDKGRRTVERQL